MKNKEYGLPHSHWLFVMTKQAFSLVEMLMALLVASLLLAALAPVMTRKFTDNVNVSGLGGAIKAPSDIQCYPYTDANPTVKIPLNNVYYANFIIASGGGGGAGATSETVLDNQILDIQSINTSNATNTILITEDMDNFEIELMIGGGGGAGGGAALHSSATCTGSASADKCECMGIKYDSINKVCVSNNQGSANFSGAATKCNALSPAGKWTVPTMTQLENWKDQYADFGIAGGNSIWSQTTSTCTTTGTTTCRDLERCDCNGCGKSTTRGDAEYSNWYATWCDKNNSPWCGFLTCNVKNTYSCSTTVSCGTNYHYYQLSGSSWSSVTNSNDNTQNRSTYCIYNDSGNVTGEKFYSLSGGGGSSAPAIKDNDFNTAAKNLLKEKIKENIGGYIVLKAGGGGEGGNEASSKNTKAGNGSNGLESCIVVQNSAKQTKFKLCAKGGNGGYGADASKTNASTEGYGKAGTKVNSENGCYTYDYTLTSNQKVEFNCTLAGKEAGNGGAGTSNPIAGGKGGASVLNSNQVSNSGKDGVTPNSTTNPGAGGGGGTATKTGTGVSSVFAFGKGGNGAGGYVKLKYKRKFPGSGGGGGGAGSVANIKNIYVDKNTECIFVIGKGGAGGNKDNNGLNGGLSSVKCNSDTRTFTVNGGTGGKKGTSAQNISGLPIGGEAGIFGDVNEYIRALDPEKKDIKRALITDEEKNKMKGIQSKGGKGQTSGTGTPGGCGGMYEELNICEVSDTDAGRINGKGFVYSDTIVPTSKDIQNTDKPSYGISGAGGGGGAWARNLGAGKGGNGMNGYVCVYWYGE